MGMYIVIVGNINNIRNLYTSNIHYSERLKARENSTVGKMPVACA